jgi:hypothetical protein
MRTIAPLLAIALLATACGNLQTTTQVRDDVYDIPERNVVYAAAGGETTPSTSGLPDGFVEDYYDPSDPGNYDLGSGTDRSYEDITYNDPQYYNYDRFGFNVGMSSWGPTYGMGISYGMPGMYGSPWGQPYYGAGWNMGISMNWGYPVYGYPPYYGGFYPYGGYAPYYPPCCYGCGGYYGNTGVYQHRPALGGGSGGGGTTSAPVPVRYRPNSLTSTRPSMSNEVRTKERMQGQRTEGSRSGGSQQRGTPSGGSRSGGSPGGGGGSRPSTGGGRR